MAHSQQANRVATSRTRHSKSRLIHSRPLQSALIVHCTNGPDDAPPDSVTFLDVGAALSRKGATLQPSGHRDSPDLRPGPNFSSDRVAFASVR
jgi:hypothetical protein